MPTDSFCSYCRTPVIKQTENQNSAMINSSNGVNVEITHAGSRKIAVIKVVRALTGLGLKEAKELVDRAPSTLGRDIPIIEAARWKDELEQQGATVVLTGHSVTVSSASTNAHQGTVDVVITYAGSRKIAVIKVVRELVGLGLREAKDLVDAAPSTIGRNITLNEATRWKNQLEQEGGRVELRSAGQIVENTAIFPKKPSVNHTSKSSFTDAEREAFLSDRKKANSSGCLIFILLPIAIASLLVLL